MTHPDVTVYFDGLCPLCSREIAHYRKRLRRGSPVEFVDIAAPDFDAAAHGLDPTRVHRVFHARVGGKVRTGLDAFTALWAAVPGYGWLARLARVPGVRGLMALGYQAFAAVRPLLPRRKPCGSGTCGR